MSVQPHPLDPASNPFDTELTNQLYRLYTLLTRKQIERLFPSRSKRNIQYRLSKLVRSRVIARRVFSSLYGASLVGYHLGPAAPSLLSVDPEDAQLLRQRYKAANLSDSTLLHLLHVNSVTIKFHNPLPRPSDYAVLAWLDQHHSLWSSLANYAFPVRPDAYAHIRIQNTILRSFIEVDRNTERSSTIRAKLAAYSDYFQSGLYRQHFQADAFRTLFIAPAAPRLAILRRLAAPYTPGLFWFALTNQFLSADLLEPIWHTAASDRKHVLSDPAPAM